MKTSNLGLGVFENRERVFLFKKSNGNNFSIEYSLNGFEFNVFQSDCAILDGENKVDITELDNFRITVSGELYLLVYRKGNQEKLLNIAISPDIKNWKQISDTHLPYSSGVLLATSLGEENYLMLYTDGSSISLAESGNLKKWKDKQKLIDLEENKKDQYDLVIGNLLQVNEGYLLTYFLRDVKGKGQNKVYALLFEDNNLKFVSWKKPRKLWEQTDEWEGESPYPLGTSHVGGRIISYWETHDGNIYAVNHPHYRSVLKAQKRKTEVVHPTLKKYPANPIVEPNPEKEWESVAVFNPAAWYDREKVHLIYRAVGEDYTSVWGYASSKDGLNIDEREGPIYTPRAPFEVNTGNYCSVSFISGFGGGGGCEDPRMTKIDDRFYVVYVAYDGRNGPRLAMTSIDENDFHNKKWDAWKDPVLISRPGIIDKSGTILPEKVNGKYVIFHRVFPDILVDYVDSLDEFDGKTWLKGDYKISPREDNWDSRKIGVGATPIKTDYGWLVIYNAVDDKDDSKYLMGAMLLDLEDPTRVLYRSNKPIMQPTEPYENGGYKYGVIYPCGAAVIDDVLYVYYGGSDTTVNVAYESLPEFIDMLKFTGGASLNIYKNANSL